MEVKMNHKWRAIYLRTETDFEAQAMWDVLCAEEKPRQAELVVVMSGNGITIQRKDEYEKD